MKCVGDRATGIAMAAPLLALLLLMPFSRWALAGDDELALPPAAAEALEQNGSVLAGSLLEALAADEPVNGGEQEDAKLVRFAEGLLRTARHLESLGEVVPNSSTLAKELRVAALHCLTRALGRSLDEPNQPTLSPVPAVQSPELPRSEDRLDPPSFTLPPRGADPIDETPLPPPSLNN